LAGNLGSHRYLRVVMRDEAFAPPKTTQRQ